MVRFRGQLYLERESDIAVVGEGANGQDAINAVASVRPDVVVMDVTMPGIDGIEATRRIRTSFTNTKVLILSMHSNPLLVQKAMDNGASGYLLKDTVSEELVQAIRNAFEGITHHSRTTKQFEYSQSPTRVDSIPLLTSREYQILQLIASGQSNRQISENLRVSVKTIVNHRTSLMAKLNTHSLTELIHKASQFGLINLEE